MRKRLIQYCPYISLYLLLGAWVLTLANPVIYSLSVNNIKARQRKNIENILPGTPRQLLSLSIRHFRQVYNEAEGEISLNGTMYDIVSYKIDGDSAQCVAIPDGKESAVHKLFGKTTHGKKQSRPVSPVFFGACSLFPAFYFNTTIPGTAICPVAHDVCAKISCGYTRFVAEPPEFARV